MLGSCSGGEAVGRGVKSDALRRLSKVLAVVLVVWGLVMGCSLPQVSAQDRLFLDISLEFLDDYTLPKQNYEGTRVGGLSGISYDRQRDRFYVLSDDRGDYAPSRYYTVKLNLEPNEFNTPSIKNLEIQGVTYIKNQEGENYSRGQINPEGIAFAAPNTIYISSEGVNDKNIPPFIQEHDRETGQWRRSLPIPQTYIPDATGEKQQRGVQDNLGFESLTINPRGFGDAKVDPYRLFTATESPVVQDWDETIPETCAAAAAQTDVSPTDVSPTAATDTPCPYYSRMMHYLQSDGPPLLIAESAYPLDLGGRWSLINGLTELLALESGGHLLALERSFGFTGYGAKIFQIATGGATDTSTIASLKPPQKLAPLHKKLLLDLTSLGIPLDNLEGMTLGPRLPDGSDSLIVISDDNFNDDQTTQVLLFRLRKK